VNVTAFSDLPTEHELKIYGLDIMTQEKLNQIQKEDKVGKQVQDFKLGKQDILYSTKCNRGVDFPGEICNSIIITRYPYPNVSSLFWRILKKTKPEYYMELYMDKSKREFLQRIYRALRSNDDEVYLLSPDIRVLMAQI
jgi:Rad3-related DNA helicase